MMSALVSDYVPVRSGISLTEAVYVALSAGLVLVLSEDERSLLRMVVMRIRPVKRDLTTDQLDWTDSVLSEHSMLEVMPILIVPADSQ